MKRATTLLKQINKLLWELPNYTASEICFAYSRINENTHFELNNIFDGYFSTMMSDEILKKYPNALIGEEYGFEVYFIANEINYCAQYDYSKGKVKFRKVS